MDEREPQVLDLEDPIYDGQTLPEVTAPYQHVHSTTGICVKHPTGRFCAPAAAVPEAEDGREREDRWIDLLGLLLHNEPRPGFYVAAARQLMALADREGTGPAYQCNYCDDDHGTVRASAAVREGERERTAASPEQEVARQAVLSDPVAMGEDMDELRTLWRAALEREGNLASAVADVIWKATQYGETEDGDTYAYIVPKGCMHRLVGVAQSNGAHVPVAFRAALAPSLPAPEGTEQ